MPLLLNLGAVAQLAVHISAPGKEVSFIPVRSLSPGNVIINSHEHGEVDYLAERDERASLRQSQHPTQVGEQPHQRGVLVAFNVVVVVVLEQKF